MLATLLIIHNRFISLFIIKIQFLSKHDYNFFSGVSMSHVWCYTEGLYIVGHQQQSSWSTLCCHVAKWKCKFHYCEHYCVNKNVRHWPFDTVCIAESTIFEKKFHLHGYFLFVLVSQNIYLDFYMVVNGSLSRVRIFF